MNFERGRSQLPETRTERSRPTTSTSFKIPGVKPRSSEGVSVKAERDTNSNSEQRLENLTHSNSQVLAREDSNPSFDKSNSRTNSLTTATEIQSRTTTATHSRIRTAQSRPQTGLSHQTGPEGSYVCAVLEHRGVGHEVGIAVMEKETGQCILTQFGDTPTYVKTIHHLYLHPPATILVPASSVASSELTNFLGEGRGGGKTFRDSSSVLVRCLEENFDLKVTPLKRIHWNDGEGASYLDRLLVDDVDPRNQSESATRSGLGSSEIMAEASSRNAILTAMSTKFYALSAVSALFKHLEASSSRVFLARTIKIKFASPEGTVMIDSDSARDLELIQNKLDRKSKMSLFGLMNKCITPMGERLLRTNILQPLTDQPTIESRLEAVEECVQSEDRFFALKESLKPLGKDKIDIDKLIASLVKADQEKAAQSIDPKRTENKIGEILSLRTFLSCLDPIHKALECAGSSLLSVIQTLLSSPELNEMQEEIKNALNEDLVTGKAPLGNRNTRIYAVKANRSPLLDIARETYSENTSDILGLLEDYKNFYRLPITLKWQAQGFHLEIKTESVSKRDLPIQFINVIRSKSGKTFSFTTLDLKKQNQRLQSSLNEVFLLSDSVVEEIRSHILARISELYKASEALSLLDMVVSFAQLVGSQGYTRPEFIDQTLAIQDGRHPILDSVKSGGVVPNNVWSENRNTFFLITGPNMSGKSTYLCQVALLTIMATIGSFVPAEYASFIIPDCILTRLSNEDSLEKNLSTFSMEMRTTAFILSIISSRSLVVVDELGRGTSPHEGFGITLAVAEELIRSRAYVFFATHFLALHESLTSAFRISSQQFQVSVDRRNLDRNGFSMAFHHRLISGCSADTYYGLELAKLANLPKTLLASAVEIAHKLKHLSRAAKPVETSLIAERRKIVLKTVAHLSQIFAVSTLPEKDLRLLLKGVQQDVVDALQATYSPSSLRLDEIIEDQEDEEMERDEVEMES